MNPDDEDNSERPTQLFVDKPISEQLAFYAEDIEADERDFKSDSKDPGLLQDMWLLLNGLASLFWRHGHYKTCNRLQALSWALREITVNGYEHPLFTIPPKRGSGSRVHPDVWLSRACVCVAVDKMEAEGMTAKEAVNVAAKRQEFRKLLRRSSDNLHTSIEKWRAAVTEEDKEFWRDYEEPPDVMLNFVADYCRRRHHDPK